MPSLTPQAMTPRCLIAASVCAAPALTHNTSAASAAPALPYMRTGNREKQLMAGSRLGVRGLMDDHLGADRNAVIKIDHGGIGLTDVTTGDRWTDGLRMNVACTPINGITNVECTNPQR